MPTLALHRLKCLALGTSLVTLTACVGQGEPLPPAQAERFAYTQVIAINADSQKAEIETRYDATAVAWQPADGYAVLGLRGPPDSRLRLQAIGSAQVNQNVVGLPESPENARALGASAWSGGNTAWSGGITAWSGGNAGSSSFSQNAAIWQKIGLAQGQSHAPKLGTGIKVAVIDTGIDLNHPAFTNRLVAPHDMWDFVDNDAVPAEVQPSSSDSAASAGYGHGTNVAGIVVQVAPKVKIMPLRVLGADGRGDATNVIAAIQFAIDHGASVINLSLSTSYLDGVNRILLTAMSLNIAVVVSSGNTGDKNISFPAAQANLESFQGMISVGSTSLTDGKSKFSTYGGALEMMAPGEKVIGPAPGNKQSTWSGTSMAAPMVSGALALARAERPDLNIATLEARMIQDRDNIAIMNLSLPVKEIAGRLNLRYFLLDIKYY